MAQYLRMLGPHAAPYFVRKRWCGRIAAQNLTPRDLLTRLHASLLPLVHPLLTGADFRGPGALNVGEHSPNIGILQHALIFWHVRLIAGHNFGHAVLDHLE